MDYTRFLNMAYKNIINCNNGFLQDWIECYERLLQDYPKVTFENTVIEYYNAIKLLVR